MSHPTPPLLPPARPRQSTPDRFLAATHLEAPLVRLHPKRHSYLLHRPETVKHVLQENHKNYRQLTPKKPLMGHRSLTMASGDAWRQRRRLMQPLFAERRLKPLMSHASKVVDEMLERWRDAAREGRPVDVAAEMVHLALETLTSILLGEESRRDRDLLVKIGDAFDFFNNRQRRGFALPRWLPTPENRKVARAIANIRDFVARAVADARRRGGGDDHLLGLLIATQDPQSGATLSDDDLVDELMMLLVMGHMTTATALTWYFYLLSRHPEVDRRVAEEAASLGGPPRPEDVPRLELTKRALEETLRLFPSTWSLTRGVLETEEIAGFEVPAGSVLVISPFVTHRLPDLWPEPEAFDPGRFLPERAAGRHRFAYFPFGGGPRSCIANQFAMLEMPLVAARIVQGYRLELATKRPVAMQAIIALEPAGGLTMRPRPRAEI